MEPDRRSFSMRSAVVRAQKKNVSLAQVVIANCAASGFAVSVVL
jgi:hypothetical protein